MGIIIAGGLSRNIILKLSETAYWEKNNKLKNIIPRFGSP